jgi:phage-related protein
LFLNLETIYIFAEKSTMIKPVEIELLPEAEDFVDNIEVTARKKLFYAIRKTKMRLFGNWFEKMKGSNGIFEFRVREFGKYYRLFAFWDNKNERQTLIVCTHGIIKKSNKTPKKEIGKAEKIKNQYFKGEI